MMLLQLAGVPAAQIADAHELGIRGINDWHRISPYRHPVESYISGDELEARVAEMRGSLLQVLSSSQWNRSCCATGWPAATSRRSAPGWPADGLFALPLPREQ